MHACSIISFNSCLAPHSPIYNKYCFNLRACQVEFKKSMEIELI